MYVGGIEEHAGGLALLDFVVFGAYYAVLVRACNVIAIGVCTRWANTINNLLLIFLFFYIS